MDAYRIVKVPGEKENFLKLLEYCRIQNDKGNTPLFVIADNPDFEYVACLNLLKTCLKSFAGRINWLRIGMRL